MSWKTEKDRFLSLSLDEKRKLYKNKEYVQVKDVPTWKEYAKTHNLGLAAAEGANATLNDKVSLYVGDITTLEVDVIVNAANSSLLGGGGVDGAIHRSAGKNLLQECTELHGCETGGAKVTGGYNLPARYVIHTVGPRGENTKLLTQCYSNSLKLMRESNLRTIAFPCVSTGIYGYPLVPAANVAISQVRQHLEKEGDSVDRVIFCLFSDEDEEVYKTVMPTYFPLK
ncbi:hypothetical protein FQA39_LY00908 [Lamprigera yunnana]|nr:hypothetical protein FQA39_LY00908 [Lamprigera yunnana]